MSDRKMYKVQQDMECQLLTEDSKIRLYLSPMHKDRTEEQDTVIEKITIFALKMIYSFSAAYFMALWIVPFAYAERGYQAYGGEWILIIITFVITFRVMSIFFKYFRRSKWKREK